MKPFLVVVCFWLLYIQTSAQLADSTIYITLHTDAKVTGRVIEEVKGRYIRVQEKNGFITRLTFPMITCILNANADTLFVQAPPPVPYIKSSEPVVIRSPYEPRDELFAGEFDYRNWYKAIIIRGADTSFAKLEPGDYSAAGLIFLSSNYSIKAVGADGKKVRVSADTDKLLAFDSKGRMVQYIKLRGELYRLVLDGKCQLFLKHTNESSGMAPGGAMVSTPESDSYFTWYKNALYFLKSEPRGIFDSFKAAAKTAFADCPALVQKIEQKVYTTHSDMTVLVKEFNECVK